MILAAALASVPKAPRFGMVRPAEAETPCEPGEVKFQLPEIPNTQDWKPYEGRYFIVYGGPKDEDICAYNTALIAVHKAMVKANGSGAKLLKGLMEGNFRAVPIDHESVRKMLAVLCGLATKGIADSKPVGLPLGLLFKQPRPEPMRRIRESAN